MSDTTKAARAASALMERILYEVKRVVVGQDRFLERVMVALLAQGHLLVEGVPGLAKTLTVRTLATTLGPVFAHLLLADEINRAPAKVQSALLEVMQERQVTIAGEPHRVPAPFVVMATQNPIETEGTYPLPEAQLDRFMMKVLVDYPDDDEEFVIVERVIGAPIEVEPVASMAQLLELQQECRKVYVDPSLITYAVKLVGTTRRPDWHGLPELARYLSFGASPRASIALVEGARALAWLRGRGYVLPQDLTDLAADTLRHRLVLSYEALAEGLSADDLIERVMKHVPVPARPMQHPG
jgi:MoxR-like ATPase